MYARTSTVGERQGFDSLPAELQQDIIQRVLRSDDVESSAAALLLVSKAWSQMVQPDRCVMELYRRDARSSKFLASASMLDAEVWGLEFSEGSDDEEGLDDSQLTTAFSQWKHLRCLQLLELRNLRCLASLRASSLRACMLQGLLLDLDDVAVLGAALQAATALEHIAVIECEWTSDGAVDGWDLARRLHAPLQLCCSLRALELQIPNGLKLASLPQLTHFHWTDRDMEYIGLGTSDLVLGSSLASLTLQPCDCVFEGRDAASLARRLTGNSTIRSLEIDVFELPERLEDAICSMTGVTRLVTNCCDPCHAQLHVGRLAQSRRAITEERLTELRLYSIGWATLLLPPRLTSLALFLEGHHSLQTFANVGHSRALRRLRLSGVDVTVIQEHIQMWVDCVDPELYWDEEYFRRPNNWLLCDLRCWAAHVDVSALAVQFLCRYVVSPLSKLTELELVIDEFPSEGDRAELQAAAACPISWVRVPTALLQDIVGVPERFRRRARRAA